MLLKNVLGIAVFTGALCAQGPTGLKVVSATRNGVELSWNGVPGATGYQVERRIEPAPYAAAGTPTKETSATDSKIDVYATYQYRVKVVGASAASNEVTVGPPPAGYNVAVPTPANTEANFAHKLTMALDANGDPIFAYIFRDPNRNNRPEENQLFFGGWDRASYSWRKPLQVDVIGRISQFGLSISLAADAATGQLALASAREGNLPSVALSSDNGKTWTIHAVPRVKGELEAAGCTVALANGAIYLAYFTPIGPLYIRGQTADEPAKWTHIPVPPRPPNTQRPIGHMALDASGQPAIVFLASLPKGVSVNYWRPGGEPSQAFDTNKVQNDAPDIRLAFDGNKPRLLFAGGRDTVAVHNIWFSVSDDGSVWSEPVVVPNDGNRGMSGPMTLAIDSKGAFAVSSRDGGGNYGGMKCGWPKLSFSSDGQQWTTCSPNPKDLTNIAYFITAAYPGDNRLYVTYRSSGPNNGINAIVVWHEGASAAANISIHK